MSLIEQGETGSEFNRSLAFVVGINSYTNQIPPLRTPVPDAEKLTEMLEKYQNYQVHCLHRQGSATLAGLSVLLNETMPEMVKKEDRVIFYFAGHGEVLEDETGPQGYLIPEDASSDSPETFLSMSDLHTALAALPCRHMLVILDCCSAGAFRWLTTRDLKTRFQRTIHRERYERYTANPAWQMMASASHDEKAYDSLPGKALANTNRIESKLHSPFAEALFRALAGQADLYPKGGDGDPGGDGLITATELQLFIGNEVADIARRGSNRQTPGMWQLKNHDRGEFVFLNPNRELNLPPAPDLNYENNPYRGFKPFQTVDAELFSGRIKLINDLADSISRNAITVITGDSGTGKSSLINAGILPHLDNGGESRWEILGVIRPGAGPLESLAEVVFPGDDSQDRISELRNAGDAIEKSIQRWTESNSAKSLLLLFVDQLEELVLESKSKADSDRFLSLLARAAGNMRHCFRLVVSVRSDFEAQLRDSFGDMWTENRCVIPQMTTNELREAIEEPALVREVYFDPETLMSRIVNDVVRMPGALPLLSHSLSELYHKYIDRGGNDRSLSGEDYDSFGGVDGLVRSQAAAVYDQFDAAHQTTMKRLLLRLVSTEGTGLSRRRVPRSELNYTGEAENRRMSAVIRELSSKRLIIEGGTDDGAYVEPAHDALIAWDKLVEWYDEEEEQVYLRGLLAPSVRDWKTNQGGTWYANSRLDLLNENRDWLNRDERAFLQESVRKRWYLRATIAMVTVVTIAVLTLGMLLAKKSRDQADDMVNYMLQDLQPTLTQIGRIDLLKGTIKEVDEYLAERTEFLDRPHLKAGMRAESARISGLMGNRSEAISQLESIARELESSGDNLTTETQFILAQVYTVLGDFRDYVKKYDEGEEACKKAIELLDDLLQSDPAHATKYRVEKAWALCHLADIKGRDDNHQPAVDLYRKAQSLFSTNELDPAKPENNKAIKVLIHSRNHAARLLHAEYEFEEAELEIGNSVTLLDQLVGEQSALVLDLRSEVYQTLTWIYFNLDKRDKAKLANEEARGICEVLVTVAPGNEVFESRRAELYLDAGEDDKFEREERVALVSQAIDISRKLHQQDTADFGNKTRLVRAYQIAGRLRINPEENFANLFELLPDGDLKPENVDFNTYQAHGRIFYAKYLAENDPSAAISELLKAESEFAPLLSYSESFQTDYFALINERIADIHKDRLGDYPGAIKFYTRAREFYEKIEAENYIQDIDKILSELSELERFLARAIGQKTFTPRDSDWATDPAVPGRAPYPEWYLEAAAWVQKYEHHGNDRHTIVFEDILTNIEAERPIPLRSPLTLKLKQPLPTGLIVKDAYTILKFVPDGRIFRVELDLELTRMVRTSDRVVTVHRKEGPPVTIDLTESLKLQETSLEGWGLKKNGDELTVENEINVRYCSLEPGSFYIIQNEKGQGRSRVTRP